jgi:hypothetical protein
MPSDASHVGLMLCKDYNDDLLKCAGDLMSRGDTAGSAAMQSFSAWISQHNSLSAFESDLTGIEPASHTTRFLPSADAKDGGSGGVPESAQPVLTLQEVHAVLASGYLIAKRDTKAVGVYYITHPKVNVSYVSSILNQSLCDADKIGELLCAVEHMSTEITRTIKKSQYKEISERSLVGTPGRAPKGGHGYVRGKKKVPKDGWAGMGWKYHIYEMAGRGGLLRIDDNSPEALLRLPTSTSNHRK